MHFTKVSLLLSGFGTLTAAIDVRLFRGGCGNSDYLGFTNVQPNACADPFFTQFNYPTMGFFAIPRNWNIITYAARSLSCNDLDPLHSNGRDTVCYDYRSQGYFGGQYEFWNGKREVDDQAGDSSTMVNNDQECVKPDLLVVRGVEYQIDGLEEDQYHEVLEFFNSGLEPEEMPAHLATLRI